MATPFPFGSGNVLTAAQMNAITTLPINDQTASYLAVVGDVGKRIVMNVATANTVTINNSIFAEGDTIFIANKGAGASTITAGAGVTINTSGSLALAQHGGGTLVALSASVFTFFSGGGASYGTATGGSSSSITVGGINYTLLTFTSDGTLTVTKSGLFDVLLIGGGGSAYYIGNGGFAHGGGGGGGVLQTTVYLSANQTVDIGAGGAPQGLTGGAPTTLGTGTSFVSAVGGAYSVNSATGETLGIFGSQMGCIAGPNTAGGANNVQGFKGGNCVVAAAGGGGGFGGVGGNGSVTTGGAGGAGVDVSTFIGGSALFKASGGGGGGTVTGGAAGSSLSNGGGTTTGNSPAANTGAGAGGGVATGVDGTGGSGILYVRFKV